jgi:hypothetical protein
MSNVNDLPIWISLRIVPIEFRDEVLDCSPQALCEESDEDSRLRVIQVKVRYLHRKDHRLT